MSARASYDYDPAAPPSFGPPSAALTGLPRRSPNDVRVRPADPDVISDLLDSFDVMSSDTFPSPIANSRNVSRPRTPTRSSRPDSRSSQFGTAKPPSIKPPNLTHRFEEVAHPIADPTELPPDEDAAEPPTIRTARPPSGFSKMTAASRSASQQGTLRRKLSSPRIMLSPPPERVTPQRPSASQRSSIDSRKPRTVRSSREGSRSPTRLQAVRESQAMAPDQFTLTTSVPPSAYKGKERESYTPRVSSLRSNAYDMQRATGSTISPPPSSRGFSSSSARTSHDLDRPFASRDVQPRATSTTTRRIIDDDSPTDSGQHEHLNQTPYTPNGRMIPERRSSAQNSESSSPVKRRLSTRSSNTSPDATRKPDPASKEPLPNRVILNEDSDNDDTLRRIAELKAARELREQGRSSLNADSTTANTEAPRTLTMPYRQPNGVVPKTSRQLREAKEVKEHRISDELDRKDDNYMLDVPPITVAPSKPLAQAVPHSSLANKRLVEASAGSSHGTAKNSFEIANKHSRQNSWSKRWSPMVKSDQPRHSTDSRPGTSRGQSVVEDRRGSIDSIQTDVDRYLMAPRLSQKVLIPGERRNVVFSEVGDPKGHAILCCVGMGLTRYIMAFYDELATSLGLRLITLDRPGIGDSESYANGPRTPLSWPDDVLALCEQLQITKFSLLAHSAGAVYALATALRLPHYLRGKIHLLAPWIPPSQLTTPPSALNNDRSNNPTPGGTLPKSQRFLRILPSSFLKLSNGSFGFSSRSSTPKPSKPSKSNTPVPTGRSRRSTETGGRLWSVRGNKHPEMPSSSVPSNSISTTNINSYNNSQLAAPTITDMQPPTPRLESFRGVPTAQHNIAAELNNSSSSAEMAASRQRAYDNALTPAIWRLATQNANPSVDLLICLERHRPIGFSYSEVGAKPAIKTLGERPGRSISSGMPVDRDSGFTGAEVDGNQWPGMGVVISHGTKDNRVPLENVRWLSGRMVRCEVRELDGLGHGLMGEAVVMGNVLKEIAGEWEVNNAWVKRGGQSRR